MTWRLAASLLVLAGFSSGQLYHLDTKSFLSGGGGNEQWRATSFAVGEKDVFVTVRDFEGSRQGQVLYFPKSSANSPNLQRFPTTLKTPIAVRLDTCNRLWILDAALNETGSTGPRLHVYDAASHNLQHTHVFPKDKHTGDSLLAYMAIDSSTCKEASAYISDVNRKQLLVFDLSKNTTRVFKHHFFSPSPLPNIRPDFLGGRFANGIYGLSIVLDNLYFHALAGSVEFVVPLKAFKNDKLSYTDIHSWLTKLPDSDAGSVVYDMDTDILFFGELNNTKGLGCAGMSGRVYNRLGMGFGAGEVVDLGVKGGELWVLTRSGSVVDIYKKGAEEVAKGSGCLVDNRMGSRGGFKDKKGSAERTLASFVVLISSVLVLHF